MLLYINKSIIWNINSLKRISVNKIKLTENYDEDVESGQQLASLLPIELFQGNLTPDDSYKKARFNILLDMIKSILTEREWEIFYCKVVEGKTYLEITKEQKKQCSIQRISQIYKKIIIYLISRSSKTLSIRFLSYSIDRFECSIPKIH